MEKVVMRIRFKGESDPLYLVDGNIYDVIEIIEEDLYRIIDETGDDYMYFLEPDEFEVVEKMAMA